MVAYERTNTCPRRAPPKSNQRFAEIGMQQRQASSDPTSFGPTPLFSPSLVGYMPLLRDRRPNSCEASSAYGLTRRENTQMDLLFTTVATGGPNEPLPTRLDGARSTEKLSHSWRRPQNKANNGNSTRKRDGTRRIQGATTKRILEHEELKS